MRWLDSIMIQWTWTWASFGRQWGKGRSGVLQSMGSQRVRPNLATEQKQHLEKMPKAARSLWLFLCFSLLWGHKTLMWEVLSLPRGNKHPYLQRQRDTKNLNQLYYFPSLLHLSHTLWPITFLSHQTSHKNTHVLNISLGLHFFMKAPVSCKNLH